MTALNESTVLRNIIFFITSETSPYYPILRQLILHFWRISVYVSRLLYLCLRRYYFHSVPKEKAVVLTKLPRTWLFKNTLLTTLNCDFVDFKTYLLTS